MILSSESGEAIREANLVKDYLTQMKFDKSLSEDFNVKMCNALSTWEKALKKVCCSFLILNAPYRSGFKRN